MGWYNIAIELPTASGFTKTDPKRVRVDLPSGRFKGIAFMFPAMSDDHVVGARVSIPRGPVIPEVAENTDAWVYGQTDPVTIKMELDYVVSSDFPTRLYVEGFNTDNKDVYIQVAVHVHKWKDLELKSLQNINATITAIEEASNHPDFEKQIRRVAEILSSIFRPNTEE